MKYAAFLATVAIASSLAADPIFAQADPRPPAGPGFGPPAMPGAMPHGAETRGPMPMTQGQMPMMHGPMMHGPGPVPGGTPSTADPPATAAFKAANAKMHRDMDIAYSGDADVDFLRAMIPHHQGAIDMARVVLAFGKDPEVKKLAEEIVRAQEAEIVQMRAMLRRLAR